MKQFILIVGFCIALTHLMAQKNILPKEALRFYFAESTHGTGDLKGISFGTSYTHYLKKKWSLEHYFKGTLHDGEDEYFYTWPGGQIKDGSVRENTSGFQIGSTIKYSFLRIKQHEFGFGAGPLLRYQSSSLGDNGYSVRRITQPGYTEVLIQFDNQSPQRRYTLGYIGELSYNFTLNKGWMIGANAAFQNDTNADAITHLGFMIGKRF